MQGLVHGTSIGDLEQALALLPGQFVSKELDAARHHISFDQLALIILCVDLLVREPHDHILERNLLAVGVHPERDARA